MTEETPAVDPAVRIIDLRNRALQGEVLSKEEIAEALKMLAQNRRSAVNRKATVKKKKSGEPLPADLGDLFKKQ